MSHPLASPSSVGRPSRWRDHQPGDKVAALAARRCGVELATVHAWLYGRGRVNLRAALLISCFRDTDEHHRLVRWMAPVEAALRGILAPADSSALAIQAATADQDEDVAEVAYLVNPCAATALQLVRAIDTERALQLERRQALVAKWELT